MTDWAEELYASITVDPRLKNIIANACTGAAYGPGNAKSVDSILAAIVGTAEARRLMRQALMTAANADPSTSNAS